MTKDTEKVKGFFLYFDQWPAIQALNDAQKAMLLEAMFHKFAGKDYVISDDVVNMAFLFVEQTFIRDKDKYLKRCEQNSKNRSKQSSTNDNDGQRTSTNVNDGDNRNIKENKEKTNIIENNNIKNTSYSLSEKVSDDTQKQASLFGEELPVEGKAKKKNPVPNCPQDKIIELYHKCLPELAHVRAWSAGNAANMRARWRDRWSNKKYSTVEEGLVYWESVFTFVHDHCPWLMGKNDREWQMDLAWFMKASNFTKFLNNKYNDNRAA